MDNMGGSAPPPPPPPPPEGGGPSSGGGFAPKGIGEILSTAFELYQKNAAQLIQIVALVVVPLTLVQAYLVTEAIGDAESSLTVNELTGEVTVNSGGGLGRAILLGIVAGLIGAIISQLLTGALTRGAAGALTGRPVDVGASYRYAFSRLGGLIGLAILIAIVVSVGFVLLIIPGVIFLVFLSMAVPAFVIERRGVIDSMSRSWNLVSGSFWHVLGAIIVAYILIYIVSSILGAIGGDSFFGTWIMSAIAQIITAPFFALVSVVLYVDLRSRREGLDAATLQRELDAAAD